MLRVMEAPSQAKDGGEHLSPPSGATRRRPPSPKQVAHRKAWGETWSAALRQIAQERKPK